MPPVDRESPGDEPMTPYQRLIRDTREAKGMTPTDLARKARLPRSTIYAVEGKEPKERPEDATIDKLASALGISREAILDAVSESLGLRIGYGRPTLATQQLLDLVRHLPADQAERWHRLARALADVLASEHERQTTEHSGNNVSDGTSARSVVIDRSIGSHGEQIVQAGPDGATPPTEAEREYADTVSDDALEQMRRRHLGQ